MKNFEIKNEEKNKVEKDETGDMEVAVFLAKHIENPCSVETASGVKNIRKFYIDEAKKSFPK